MDDLERLKYTELRNLAKKLGLKAKGKADKLIRDISKHYEDNGTSTSSDKKTSSSVSSASGSEDNEVDFSLNPVPPVADAEEDAEQSIDDEIVFMPNPSLQNEANTEHNKSAELESMDEKFGEIEEEVQNRSIEFEEHQATESEVVDDEVMEQLNTTFEITEVDKDDQIDDVVVVKDNPVVDAGEDKDDHVDHEEKEEEKENQTKEEGEKGDGVQNLLEVMRPEMTDEEMKAELLAAIDRKVQNRKVTIMSPNAASTEFVSRIPTFSTTNKSQTNEEKATLKGKDWQKIHEKLFSKQDGLDVYLEKKNKRMKKMNTPLKSSKRIAEESQKTAEKLKKRKGLRSTAKSPAPKPKPVQQSFIPKIVSTKSMSLQFATTKTTISSVTKSARTPVASTNKIKMVKSAKKSPVKSSSDSVKKTSKRTPKRSPQKMSPTKSPMVKRPFSPYNFGNQSSTGTPNSAQKPKFDLKASLAKPITWKKHTGKLRPMAFGTVEPQYFKMGLTTSIQNNRENRRADTAKSRTNRRENLLNSRRNIK